MDSKEYEREVDRCAIEDFERGAALFAQHAEDALCDEAKQDFEKHAARYRDLARFVRRRNGWEAGDAA